jgi:hypothetical protein
MTTFDPEALLADARRRHQAALERVNRNCARKGVQTASFGARRRATRRVVLTPEQRSAALKAKRGPLGWIFTGSSPEDVIRDSTTLKKIMRIYRDRPRMRQSSGRCIIHLPSGKEVRFHPRTGEVTRS